MNAMIISSPTLIRETTVLTQLVIEPGGSLFAPEGRFIALTVNGTGFAPLPGRYTGDVVITVADNYHMAPHGLMLMINRSEEFRSAAVIEDNRYVAEKSVPAVVSGGRLDGYGANGVTVSSEDPSFNGIVITGKSDYTIKDSRFLLDGFGGNDFIGLGAGVTAIDNARVTIDNCDFRLSGVTRCAVHVGGDSVVTVNNSRIENFSPDDPEWMGDFSWGCGFCGSNRVVQLCDNGTVYYNNCDVRGNGWGVFSIDGCDDSVSVYVRDSRVDLSGPRSHGYGGFCIGDRNVVSFDHCKMNISAYPMLVRGMTGQARAEIKNGCDITSGRFGVVCIGDKNTPVTVSDSRIRSKSSTLCVKGSATEFFISGSVLEPESGVILQLMDNDEGGMDVDDYKIPVGMTDVRDETRDLAKIDPALDVIVNLADMDVRGDFFNSTTDLHAERSCTKGGMNTQPTFGGMFAPPEGAESILDLPAPGGAPEVHHDHDEGLRGAKNMLISLRNTRLEGLVSSAAFAYREGLTTIDQHSRRELSNITQVPAPSVNNGAVLRLDRDSTWIVTGKCWLSGLTLEEGALVRPLAGKRLRMTVNGTEVPAVPGEYRGEIVVSAE